MSSAGISRRDAARKKGRLASPARAWMMVPGMDGNGTILWGKGVREPRVEL